MKNKIIVSSLLALSVVLNVGASNRAVTSSSHTDTEPKFRELYKELVETNTTLSSGDCTLAANRMADRLRAAGFQDSELNIFTVPDHPKEGGLIATLPGTDSSKKAILLLAHIDVVEAKREDWVRDPFTFIEEGGYFYARGVFDDKAMAAMFTDTLVRYRTENYRPARTIKMALTCGEETQGAFNGAKWLANNHKDWIDAEFALNEGAGGLLDRNGNMVVVNVLAGEKVYQDFVLETTNPGGHSSRPDPKNAIYEMAQALGRVSQYRFPIQLNDTTRQFFNMTGQTVGGDMGNAMQAVVRNPNDEAALSIVTRDNMYNSMLRTTCVATMINGGHAQNALPQRVRANVNCRIFPGNSVESVRDALVAQINSDAVSVEIKEPRSPGTPTPTLPAQVMRPIEQISGREFRNIPIVPTMSTGATDAIYLNAAGIPTYGFSAIFGDPDGNGMHGLNERVRVKSIMDARRFNYELIKRYTEG